MCVCVCVNFFTLQSKQDKKHKKQQAILQELQGAISREVGLRRGRPGGSLCMCAPHPVPWAMQVEVLIMKFSTGQAACLQCRWTTWQGANSVCSVCIWAHLGFDCCRTLAITCLLSNGAPSSHAQPVTSSGMSDHAVCVTATAAADCRRLSHLRPQLPRSRKSWAK